MLYMIKKVVLSALLVLSCSSAQAVDVIYPRPQSDNDARFDDLIELLETALEVTKKEYGAYTLSPSQKITSEGRYLEEVKSSKNINIIYASTSTERENALLPIRIPLRRGLLGYRLFLIDINKQHLFYTIENVDQLKELTLGQGHDWGDLNVYRPQGFKLETASKYENLFKMLLKGRFDYFPRGVNEAWVEFDDRTNHMPNLVVEPDLMLFYPWPYYFFVSKDNAALAKRVEKGLNTMIDNGLFNEVFFKYHGETIRRAEMSKRRLFRINNPILPKGTPPLSNQRLWYYPTLASKKSEYIR